MPFRLPRTILAPGLRQQGLRVQKPSSCRSSHAISTDATETAQLEHPLSYAASREAVKRRTAEMQLKYADKLKRKMEEEGVDDLQSLKAKAIEGHKSSQPLDKSDNTASPDFFKRRLPSDKPVSRTDSSPLKPLGQILNLDRLLERPHSAELIHQLWTTYHSTKERHAYLSATIPVSTYKEMAVVAEKYPLFVLPLPRAAAPGEDGNAWEFYILEWAFFQRPAEPKTYDQQFTSPSAESSRNLRCSTVLFTPLSEYKLHQAFARPYLVISHYTDLSHSHGLVLLRGEITPSENDPGRPLLRKEDAHMLAMGLQRFYLHAWQGTDPDSSLRRQLLTDFHQNQANFEWEKLLDVAWKT